MTTPTACSIAGSDPSGGAGIQADLKTFHSHGVYGCAVLTALTAQNTRGVAAVHVPPADFVAQQLATLLEDVTIHAGKTGMLADAAIIDAVVATLQRSPLPHLVVDPVMVATSGDRLLAAEAETALRDRLLPLAKCCTPNLPEAAVLLGHDIDSDPAAMAAAARELLELGPQAIYLKGGHGAGDTLLDVFCDRERLIELPQPRIDTPHTHGTGCTLSAAIAARLARGDGLEQACRGAQAWLHRAIAAGRSLGIGNGHGPVDHRVPATDH